MDVPEPGIKRRIRRLDRPLHFSWRRIAEPAGDRPRSVVAVPACFRNGVFTVRDWVGGFVFHAAGVAGEWAGSLVGSILMALVITLAFGVIKTFFAQAAALFIANSAGYFLGALLYSSIRGKTGMLLWGVLYGLCLGSGLGLSLFLAQRPLREHLNNLKPRGNSGQI